MTPLPLRIRRHATARRMVLRLSPDGRELLLTLPKRASEKAGIAFVAAQEGWVRKQQQKMLAQRAEPSALVPDAVVPLFGQECWLRHQPGQRGVRYTGGTLSLGGEEAYFSRRVQDWIKREAARRYGDSALRAAESIGQRISAITLRDSKTRWGSCSKTGRISLSWRLAFAPAEVAQYVILHEVAHLQHFDHSPAFWALVAKLDPQWKTSRDWLKQHGKTLHGYG